MKARSSILRYKRTRKANIRKSKINNGDSSSTVSTTNSLAFVSSLLILFTYRRDILVEYNPKLI